MTILKTDIGSMDGRYFPWSFGNVEESCGFLNYAVKKL
jgi:hypothetical protein